jgi:hypothetical protein
MLTTFRGLAIGDRFILAGKRTVWTKHGPTTARLAGGLTVRHIDDDQAVVHETRATSADILNSWASWKA